jgi:hypothetical protein
MDPVFRELTVENCADGLVGEEFQRCLNEVVKSWENEDIPEDATREVILKIKFTKARNAGMIDIRVESEAKVPKHHTKVGRAQLTGTIGKLKACTFERAPEQIDIEDEIERVAKSEIIDLDQRKRSASKADEE